MDGLNVVWQTRKLPTEVKEMELSIVYSINARV
jgi:hypothetical protein